MKKRFFALLTAVCIALTTGLTTGLTALADGGENSDMTIGMSTQEQCSCTTLCTEGNINPDCPVCGAEGADLTACKGAPLMMRAAPLAAAEGAPNSLYVGNYQITSSDTTTYLKAGSTEGSLTEGSADDWTVKYDPSTATLTLSGATITGSGDITSSSKDAGIYAQCNSDQSVSLTIELIGNNNTITGSYGIYVNAEIDVSISGTDASLTITSEYNGSLEVSGSNHGIFVKSGTGKASLTINDASVVAKTTQTYSGYAGVYVQSSTSANTPQLSLTVNGGSLTASGGGNNDGIQFYVGAPEATNATTSLTVTDNAIVDAKNGGISAKQISNPINTDISATGSNGGIVFDNGTGTVYGDVTLQEDLKIGEGESLTLDDGASLNAGNHNVIVDGGTLDEKLANSLGDSVKYAPTITTTDLPNGTVDAEYKQTLIADGTAPITWSVTGGSLPDGLSLSEDGVLSGTPTAETAEKDFTFTVTATNDAGSDSKEFTLTIGVAPVYSITAEPLKLDFGTLTEGYTPASQMVTITNNGNQPLTLNQPASTEHFEVGNLSTLTLPANGTATFTVQPKAGLTAGTYSEDITVSGTNATATISASLTVQKASVPTKPEVPSTGTTSGDSTGESTYPDVEDAQTSYEQATRDFWNRTINKIKKADEGDSLRIYIGIHEEIPGDVIQAIRENGVNVTFYNQDGDEVTVYAESAPTKYQAVWTLKQLGNYVLTEQQTPAAQEESPAAQQPADEPTTPTQTAETEAVDTAKPNPSTGEGSGAVIAVIAAAAALAGLGATLRKR